MDEEVEQIVMEQMAEVQAQHPNLELVRDLSGGLRVCGAVGFSIEHDSHTIEDTYQVEIHVPDDYPATPPIAFETGNKIPSDFEHFMPDGSLCLGAPIKVRREFLKQKNILLFINSQLIPYLFNYSHKRDYGELPFGELSHGGKGIQEAYQSLFSVHGLDSVLGLLKVLADSSYRGHLPCPCSSGHILRRCHGSLLLELSSVQSAEQFTSDAAAILVSLTKEDLGAVEKRLFPKSILKEIDSRSSIGSGMSRGKYQ